MARGVALAFARRVGGAECAERLCSGRRKGGLRYTEANYITKGRERKEGMKEPYLIGDPSGKVHSVVDRPHPPLPVVADKPAERMERWMERWDGVMDE